MVKIQLIFVIVLFIGLAVGLPLKEQEIDELIYRLQELKHQGMPATKVGVNDKHRSNESKQLLKKTTDLDRNHLLYDYYATGIAPSYDLTKSGYQKRFDEIDRIGFNNLNRRSSKTRNQNFDEIDRNGFDNFQKREFDEIDRIGFNGL